jgi:hypothetical protein
LIQDIRSIIAANCVAGNSSGTIPAGFARTSAEPAPSVLLAGVQARRFVIAGDSRQRTFDAVTAKSGSGHYETDRAFARQNAGSEHGEQHDAGETNLGNFCTSTRDRVRAHHGVSVSINLK